TRFSRDWSSDVCSSDLYADPRTDRLGWRVLLPENLTDKALIFLEAEKRSARDYESHRIALGVPRGGLDFAYGDAFPHEANMDRQIGRASCRGRAESWVH